MKLKCVLFYVALMLPLITFAGGPDETKVSACDTSHKSISQGNITIIYNQGNGGTNDHHIIISNRDNTISDKLIKSPFIKGNWICSKSSGALGEIFDHRGEIGLSGDYVSFYTKAYEGSYQYYMKISDGSIILKVENNNVHSIMSGGILEALSYQDRGGNTYIIIRNKEGYKELGIGVGNIKSLKKINSTIVVSGVEYIGSGYNDLYRSKISYDITNNKWKRIIKYKFKLLD